MADAPRPRPWREIAAGFLKVGATAYGGPAIMGVMQAEFQERRQWVSRPRFLEGMALVNVLPGATAVQLGIFLGHARAGWRGGVLAGLAFVTPGFLVMLALAVAYAALGVSPIIRGALYGLGPVVLAIFAVALLRLGRSALRGWPQRCIALAAAVGAAATGVGTVGILLLAGAVGLWLFHSRRLGSMVIVAVLLAVAIARFVGGSAVGPPAPQEQAPGLGRVVGLFAALGAFTFGGGLAMVPLLEEHVVGRLHWLTPQEFLAGLALGQLTPGPVLMIAAYVGYKILGIGGAVAAAVAAFLPSFVLMLALMPLFDRVRNLAWARAVIQGVGPGVIGVMTVALARMTPAAVPDLPAALVLLAAAAALLVWRLAPLKAIAGGAVVGVLRSRLCDFPGVRTALCAVPWPR